MAFEVGLIALAFLDIACFIAGCIQSWRTKRISILAAIGYWGAIIYLIVSSFRGLF